MVTVMVSFATGAECDLRHVFRLPFPRESIPCGLTERIKAPRPAEMPVVAKMREAHVVHVLQKPVVELAGLERQRAKVSESSLTMQHVECFASHADTSTFSLFASANLLSKHGQQNNASLKRYPRW